ncbi:MAG: CHAT domain-containing tetratricopeptide repeat protein [Microcoleaceae cyanobacterium]
MFTPSQPLLKWLAAGFGAMSLWFAVPVTVMAEEFSTNQVLLAQQSDELEEAWQKWIQGLDQFMIGNFEVAITSLEQALSVYRRLRGSEDVFVKGTEKLLEGVRLAQVGQTQEAKVAFEQALALLAEVIPISQSDELKEAEQLERKAEQLEQKGQYDEAEVLLLRSLDIYDKALETDNPLVGRNILSLASLYQTQRRFNEAEPLYQRGLTIIEKALGADHPAFVHYLNRLALLYIEQGRYDKAEALYQRSLTIAERTVGVDHPTFAQWLYNLAHFYSIHGRYSDAEALYQRSLEIWDRIGHSDIAFSLTGLANLYLNQGRYSDAEALYQRSLAIREKAWGTEHYIVANSLNNLAVLYTVQGRYSDAEALLQRALTLFKKAFGIEHPDVASTLSDLADLYSKQGRYDQAESFYQRSLAIREKVLRIEHPKLARSLINLARFYRAKGDITQAISFQSQGLEVQEQNLNVLLATGSERQKQDSMKMLANTTNAAISLHLKDAPNNSEAARLALTTILRRKARILDTVTNELQLIRANITPENQQLLDELNAIQSQRGNLLYNPPKDLPPEQYRQLTENLRAQAEELEAELSIRSAEFRVETEPVTIEKLQQLIPEDTALVEIIQYYPLDAKARQWGKPRYAAYIISANSINWVDLGEAEPIDQKVNEFRRDLGEKRTNVENSARELDEIVMQPIREKLGDKTHILISPDGQLNLIPFAALMDENNEYLVKNYLFTYLTTGRDLLKLQLDAPSRQNPVMLANPNYDAPGNSTGVQLASTSLLTEGEGSGERFSRPNLGEESGVRGNQRSTDLASLTFGSLEGTKIEADAIVPIVPNLQLLTGSQATENVLKQLQAPKILHIATHGFFLQDVDCIPVTGSRSPNDAGFNVILNPDFQPDCKPTPSNTENPLLRSGLALAGANPRQSGDEDGVLTASEVTQLRLYGTKLVVLSACETGVGSVANGEGVYGLRRAFVKSGAESQLMSLWKVDDYGTSELMSMYYQRIKKGEPRSQAMRQVQLELLQAPAYQHPFYWSSFIFSGDWRPMETF